LIHRLDGIAKQVRYVDDSAAGSSLERLRSWWDLLVEIGPLYGYLPNGSKTHVLAKPHHVEAAKEIFTLSADTSAAVNSNNAVDSQDVLDSTILDDINVEIHTASMDET